MECELNPRVDLGPILHFRAATLPVTVFLALASLVMLPRVVVELSRAPWEGRRRDDTTGATLFASVLALGVAIEALRWRARQAAPQGGA